MVGTKSKLSTEQSSFLLLPMVFMKAKGWPASRAVGQAANLRLFHNIVISCWFSNSVCRELAGGLVPGAAMMSRLFF